MVRLLVFKEDSTSLLLVCVIQPDFKVPGLISKTDDSSVERRRLRLPSAHDRHTTDDLNSDRVGVPSTMPSEEQVSVVTISKATEKDPTSGLFLVRWDDKIIVVTQRVLLRQSKLVL